MPKFPTHYIFNPPAAGTFPSVWVVSGWRGWACSALRAASGREKRACRSVSRFGQHCHFIRFHSYIIYFLPVFWL